MDDFEANESAREAFCAHMEWMAERERRERVVIAAAKRLAQAPAGRNMKFIVAHIDLCAAVRELEAHGDAP